MKKRQRSKILTVVIALILVVIVLYSGLRILESTVLYKQLEMNETIATKRVVKDGVSYFPRKDITVFLIMGIEESDSVGSNLSNGNSGESDIVMIAIFDDYAKNYQILALNRDSMVEMPILGLDGRKEGTAIAQLALAHTYGSGLEDSCENTKQTVSDLLGGIRIHYYLSFNMDAVTILNDAVGGVTVTVTDDFSDVDPTISVGEMTLNGRQAHTFIRVHQGGGTQLNDTRTERQKEYVRGFIKAVAEESDMSGASILEIYQKIGSNMVTNCSVNVLSTLVERFSTYELIQILTPEGRHAQGNTNAEFYLDEEALDALVLELFYMPK